MRNQLFCHHIQHRVEPTIEPRARVMADNFYQFLNHLNPNLELAEVGLCEPHVVAFPLLNPDECSPPRLKPDPFQISAKENRFHQDLQKAFKAALTWRVSTYKKCQLDFDFRWAGFSAPYQNPLHQVKSDHEGNSSYERVVICYMPLIFRRVQEKTLGKFGPWMKVVDAVVLGSHMAREEQLDDEY